MMHPDLFTLAITTTTSKQETVIGILKNKYRKANISKNHGLLFLSLQAVSVWEKLNEIARIDGVLQVHLNDF